MDKQAQKMKLDKNAMKQYHDFVDCKTTNGEIFKAVRSIQIDAKEHYNINVENIVDLYYYLVEYRDKLAKSH